MPPKNPNAEQVMDAIQQTRKEVILPAVPHAETDWKIWRFKLIKKVRARLLPMKQKEGMEEREGKGQKEGRKDEERRRIYLH